MMIRTPSATILAAMLLPSGGALAAPEAAPAKTPTIVSMKQVTVTLDPAGDAKVNGDKVAAFQSATLGIFSCADVEAVAKTVGASVTDAPNVPVTALPSALRETVGTMKIGTATQMFGDRSEGKVRVLVLCARR